MTGVPIYCCNANTVAGGILWRHIWLDSRYLLQLVIAKEGVSVPRFP